MYGFRESDVSVIGAISSSTRASRLVHGKSRQPRFREPRADRDLRVESGVGAPGGIYVCLPVLHHPVADLRPDQDMVPRRRQDHLSASLPMREVWLARVAGLERRFRRAVAGGCSVSPDCVWRAPRQSSCRADSWIPPRAIPGRPATLGACDEGDTREHKTNTLVSETQRIGVEELNGGLPRRLSDPRSFG